MRLLIIFIYVSFCLSQEDYTIEIDAHDYDVWKYFSFESGSEVEIDDPENSLDWDLGFKRNNIKSNSGLSGIGDGGGYVDESQIWNDDLWNSISVDISGISFEIDEIVEGGLIPLSGCYCNQEDQVGCEDQQSELMYPFIDCIKNPVLDRWGNFSGSGGNSNYFFYITNYILLVKTAKGEYFQFWPYVYYSPNGPDNGGGWITFKYKKICDIEDMDCAGDCGGDAVVDECGICDGDGPLENFDCDGNCIVDIDCNDECGGSTVVDECGICGGTGPGDCGCNNIPEGACDCDGNVLDCAGECGGDGILLGDINDDNTSNIEDIIQTINYIIDEVYFDDCQINAADYNENGFINVIDVLLMENAINP